MDNFKLDTWLVTLCASELMEAVLAVRGEQGLMQILTQNYGLRPSARLCALIVSESETIYSLSLDSIDRHENALVGMDEAEMLMPVTSHACLYAETRNWVLDDFKGVSSQRGCRALLWLGVVNVDNIQHCTSACRDAFFARDLGL